MSEELDAKSVSIADVLSGRSYPTETVEVYMDEGVAYEISKVNAEIAIATKKSEDTADLEKRLEDLVKKGSESRLTFHLRGISRHDRQNIVKAVMEEHPQKTDFLGRPEPDLDADEMYTNLTWAALTEKIEVSAGVVEPVGTDDINLLRANLPDGALETIAKAVSALTEGAKSGFETLAQEHGFLSQR